MGPESSISGSNAMWRFKHHHEVWFLCSDPAITSSDYDSTHETNNSDSSDFAQNEEDRGHAKKPDGPREGHSPYRPESILLHSLLPAEVFQEKLNALL